MSGSRTLSQKPHAIVRQDTKMPLTGGNGDRQSWSHLLCILCMFAVAVESTGAADVFSVEGEGKRQTKNNAQIQWVAMS